MPQSAVSQSVYNPTSIQTSTAITSMPHDPWYVIGADIATILGPVIAFVGFFLVYRQIKLSKDAIEESRKQTEQMTMQTDLLRHQQENFQNREAIIQATKEETTLPENFPLLDLFIGGYGKYPDLSAEFHVVLLSNIGNGIALNIKLYATTIEGNDSQVVFNQNALAPNANQRFSFKFKSESPIVNAIFVDPIGNSYKQSWEIHGTQVKSSQNITLVGGPDEQT
ncbi:hypothetical protein LLE49_08020 [Alicyclobacillus tolerans]|uniref:hypothetical protein n=1 Tax=Alicyclobacillus tolerans TaxID=90970 RepID=UPI001F44426C|nr:hypothetical protein [Alicyclobacillus tolerans]MCF8564692.1 hypothetical protein [Alicyclobacillus tolerans]